VDLLWALYGKHEDYYRQTLAVQRTWRRAISAILTPEQRLRWMEMPVRADLESRAAKAKLSEDQKARLDAVCVDAAQRIMQLPEPRSQKDIDRILDAAWQRVTGRSGTP
jgi:hypothetical protein